MENILLENDLVEEREKFKVCDLETATYAFRKLRAIENKEADIKNSAEKEINRINSWKEKELDQYAKNKEYFRYLLEVFYREEKAKDKKFKLSTPYGKVTSSTQKVKFFYDNNEQTIINYCEENNIKAIKEQKILDKKILKNLCPNGVNEETGEIIPGLRVEKDVMSVTIKVE